MKKEMRKLAAASAVVAAAGAFAACGDDGGGKGEAMVRFVHLAPDADDLLVDVFVDGKAPEADSALDNIAFNSATPYVAVKAGASIEIYVDGDSPDAENPDPLYQSGDDLSLEKDQEYTIAALGDGTSGSVVVDGLPDADAPDDEQIGEDEAWIRAVHGASGVDSVDILSGGAAILSDISFGEHAPTGDAFELAVDNYVLEIAPTGTTNALFEYEIAIPASGYYVAYAVNVDDDADVELVVLLQDGTLIPFDPVEYGELRAFHAASADEVDVYVDGELLIDDLGRLTASSGGDDAFARLRAGSYDVVITEGDAADASSPIASLTVPITDKVRETVFALDDPDSANGVILSSVADDGTTAGTTSARLTAVHAASAFGTVDLDADINSDAPVVIAEDFAPGDSVVAELTARTLTAIGVYGVDASHDALPEVSFSSQIPAGLTAQVYIVGNGTAGYPAQLVILNGDNSTLGPISADAYVRLYNGFDDDALSPVVGVAPLGEVGYREVSRYMSVPAADDAAISLGDGVSTGPSSVASVELVSGSVHTLAVYPEVDGLSTVPSVSAFEDDETPADDNAKRIDFVNLSMAQPSITMFGTDPLIVNSSFEAFDVGTGQLDGLGKGTDPNIDFLADSYTFRVDVTGDDVAEASHTQDLGGVNVGNRLVFFASDEGGSVVFDMVNENGVVTSLAFD